MKKLIISLSLLFLVNLLCIGQKIQRPSEGKSIVYFIGVYYDVVDISKTKAVSSNDIINWKDTQSLPKIFDGESYLGTHDNYYSLYYECDPGEHVFWADKSIISIIKAKLLPNKVYMIYIPIKNQTIEKLSQQVPILQSLSPDLQNPINFQILPISKSLNSCAIQEGDVFIKNKLVKREHKSISVVIPNSRRKVKKNNELIRKFKILYKHKMKTKELIPVLSPDMFLDKL